MGRPRKDPSKLSRGRDVRRHHESDARAWTELEPTGTGPVVMGSLPDGLHEGVYDWWAAWASAGGARLWSTDVMVLRLLVPLVDRYFRRPDVKLLGEIRRTEATLGATFVDRVRLAQVIEP